ncbi:MAG: SpoIIE family protein phosphatase [Streptosporangiales bacterium]|nr:SpoIIE family protein phosphatase [Streptosporangiales bacterium]
MSATFEADGRAVAAARGFVREALLEWKADDDIVDDAVLLTSELVTNAVVHAGTPIQVVCRLEAGAVRVEVEDQHPTRGLPEGRRESTLEEEQGRGLLVSATLASAWGVTYTRTGKCVWFQLDVDAYRAEHSATTLASPIGTTNELPALVGGSRIAVVRTDLEGNIRGWNGEAAALFGWSAAQVRRLSLAELFAWPDESGLALADVVCLARWQGECTVRHRDGRMVPVFVSALRGNGEDGEPTVVWLVVDRVHRALLDAGLPHPTTTQRAGSDEPDILPDSLVARLTLDEMVQRTVERARDVLGGDAAYLLLAREDETELEIRASTGTASGLPRRTRLAAEELLGGLNSSRLPVVHDDVGERSGAMILLRGTGMRSLLTVPLLVEARIVGILCVAAERPGRFDNDDAIRLQDAADRIALTLERARLAELERASRGWLSFLAEASDLLAGTLDQQMTLALVAQLVVPRLATWCALYTVDEGGMSQLAYVWHADESRVDALRSALEKAPAPEPRTTTGVRPWPDPASLPRPLGSDLAVSFPLVARGRSLGTLVLGRSGGTRFPRDVLALAEDLGRRAAVALDNARLYSERAATSQALQRSLLPPEVPEVAGAELAVLYTAAGEGNEVGGDFYDVSTLDGDTWRFVVGDVCGTGPEAAAVTGLARHMLRILAREGYSIPAILERLNTAILDEGPRARFLTLVSGELAVRAGGGLRLSVVSAGHPPPLRLRPDGAVDEVAEPQPLLGVLDELTFTADVVELEPGDVLLCVTDGVTERRNGDRLLGDDDGLNELLADCTGLSAGAVAARIQRAVTDFAPQPARDDIAILALRAR